MFYSNIDKQKMTISALNWLQEFDLMIQDVQIAQFTLTTEVDQNGIPYPNKILVENIITIQGVCGIHNGVVDKRKNDNLDSIEIGDLILETCVELNYKRTKNKEPDQVIFFSQRYTLQSVNRDNLMFDDGAGNFVKQYRGVLVTNK